MTTRAAAAVKVLHPEHDKNPVLVRRFLQEGQLAAQIRHPCLVPAHDLGWIGGRYTVFELVEGRASPHRSKIGRCRGSRASRSCSTCSPALAALHARGVAHRDISPNNCMIEVHDGTERAPARPRVRACDRGQAGLVLTPPDASESMIIYGSEGFIAPERLHGRPGDYRADVFSVGALWYAMLTASPPLRRWPTSPRRWLTSPPRRLPTSPPIHRQTPPRRPSNSAPHSPSARPIRLHASRSSTHPGRAIKINGARPLGGVGLCVEDVLDRHPPQRAVTLTL
jgi:serine/threonine protein kinase